MTSFIKQLGASLREDGSDANLKRWAHDIIQNNIKLIDLVKLLDEAHPVPMRFSWLIGGLCELQPKIVYPAVSHFFSERNHIRIPNFERSLAKMFWLAGVPEEIEGEAIHELFGWLQDTSYNVSTKSYALSALHSLAQKHPDLKHELKAVVEDQLYRSTTSFEKRAQKILDKL